MSSPTNTVEETQDWVAPTWDDVVRLHSDRKSVV